MSKSLAKQLVTANRIMANEGIYRPNTGLGHVSLREPGSDEMLIALSKSPGVVTEDDIVRMRIDDGTLVTDTDRSPYLENVIHRSIYRERDDVNAVAHIQTPSVLVLACTDIEWKTVFHNAAPFHEGVPRFGDYDLESGWLIVNEEEADRMADVLGDRRAVLLDNHGANVVASDIKELVMTTMFFVINAEYQYMAETLGDPMELSGPPEMFDNMINDGLLVPVVQDRVWEYLESRLD